MYHAFFIFLSLVGLQQAVGRGRRVILFTMQASVEDRLRSLELTTEALARRLDSLAGQRQLIAQENSVSLEESRQQLARPRPRLQPIQNPPARTGPANNTEASRSLVNEQTHYYYPQPAQPSSTAALSGQRADFGRYPVHPQANFMGGVYPQYYAPEIAPDNKWQCWSCCMLWWGLIMLLGGIGMAITGSLLLVQYFDSICQSPKTKYGSQCCYGGMCKNLTNYTSYTVPVIFLCAAFVTGVTGICFLARAHRIYRNNNATCC